jgi:hypothetical protein
VRLAAEANAPNSQRGVCRFGFGIHLVLTANFRIWKTPTSKNALLNRLNPQPQLVTEIIFHSLRYVNYREVKMRSEN